MQNMLVALDFSDTSDKTLEVASVLVKLTGGSLCLLHVAHPESQFVGHQLGRKVIDAPPPEGLSDQFEALSAATETLRAEGVDARSLMVRGEAVECILEESQRLGVDLIVLGTHGHSALYRSFVGSVSEGVLRGAHCPILVVP